MEKILCDERHRRIDEKFELAERRNNNHSEKIDRVEQSSTRLEERLSGLITQLDTLNTTLRWFIGLMVGAFVSFFFYAVQSGILK